MLQYTMQGPVNGPLVVFLHAGGVSSWMWRDIVARLPDMRSLLVDLPGHGQSRDMRWVSLEDTAAQVEEVVMSVAVDAPVHLAALSLGSYVASHILANGRLNWASAMLSGMHSGDMPSRRLMKVMTALMAPITNRPFMARKTARMMVGEGGDIDGYVADAIQTRTQAIWRAVADVIDFETPAGLRQTDARVLFCAGAKENDVILRGLDHLSGMIASGQTMRVGGGGHGWPVKRPDLFAQRLRDHIGTAA